MKTQSNNKLTGAIGEQYAKEYLRNMGYGIWSMNNTSRWGEIDLIAEKDHIIHFVEVKTRKSNRQGRPVEAVTYHKLKKLQRTIEFYILSHNLQNRKFQIDVIGIVLADDNSIIELKYYPNVATNLLL